MDDAFSEQLAEWKQEVLNFRGMLAAAENELSDATDQLEALREAIEREFGSVHEPEWNGKPNPHTRCTVCGRPPWGKAAKVMHAAGRARREGGEEEK